MKRHKKFPGHVSKICVFTTMNNDYGYTEERWNKEKILIYTDWIYASPENTGQLHQNKQNPRNQNQKLQVLSIFNYHMLYEREKKINTCRWQLKHFAVGKEITL